MLCVRITPLVVRMYKSAMPAEMNCVQGEILSKLNGDGDRRENLIARETKDFQFLKSHQLQNFPENRERTATVAQISCHAVAVQPLDTVQVRPCHRLKHWPT